MKSYFDSIIFCLCSVILSACSGGTKSGVFNANSYCTTPSCSTTSAAPAVRIANDSTNLSKTSDLQLQIGGVCNPGDTAYNEISLTVKRNATCLFLSPATHPAFGEVALVEKGYCESGRFNIVVSTNTVRGISACDTGVIAQYTFTAQIYTGTSSSNITAGPKYSSDISIQH